jgi:hypothetical protein
MEVIKYSSIGQFRNLVKDVQFAFKDALPKLKFTGTVKVHGTNASVVIKPDGEQYPQSRNNVLTIESDNLGFAVWHHGKKQDFLEIDRAIREECDLSDDSTVVIYGEWAGKGIQRGVAVSEVDKFFYVFGVKVVSGSGESSWLRDYPTTNSHNGIIYARDVWVKSIVIDFAVPNKSQNELVDLTMAIEEECPVGVSFGVKGVGEGVVWEHITDNGERFSCKVKGEKHSSSKVEKLASVDTEKVNSIDEFVTYAVTENRLSQGFLEVCGNDADRAMLGKFIKWVSSDVAKEEADTLCDSGLTMKDIGGTLSKRARNWFFSKESL